MGIAKCQAQLTTSWILWIEQDVSREKYGWSESSGTPPNWSRSSMHTNIDPSMTKMDLIKKESSAEEKRPVMFQQLVRAIKKIKCGRKWSTEVLGEIFIKKSLRVCQKQLILDDLVLNLKLI